MSLPSSKMQSSLTVKALPDFVSIFFGSFVPIGSVARTLTSGLEPFF